ncbi:MAG TPA: hypothetical protein VGK24_09590 [Candidatus Angelobacter sp.]|jgi:hypothetical protein
MTEQQNKDILASLEDVLGWLRHHTDTNAKNAVIHARQAIGRLGQAHSAPVGALGNEVPLREALQFYIDAVSELEGTQIEYRICMLLVAAKKKALAALASPPAETATPQEPEREKNKIRSMAWAFYQVLGCFYGMNGPARIMNWFYDVAHGEDRDVAELFPITPEEREKYEWNGAAAAPEGKTPATDTQRRLIGNLLTRWELMTNDYVAVSGELDRNFYEAMSELWKAVDRGEFWPEVEGAEGKVQEATPLTGVEIEECWKRDLRQWGEEQKRSNDEILRLRQFNNKLLKSLWRKHKRQVARSLELDKLKRELAQLLGAVTADTENTPQDAISEATKRIYETYGNRLDLFFKDVRLKLPWGHSVNALAGTPVQGQKEPK